MHSGDLIEGTERPTGCVPWLGEEAFGWLGLCGTGRILDMPFHVSAHADMDRSIALVQTMHRLNIEFEPWTVIVSDFEKFYIQYVESETDSSDDMKYKRAFATRICFFFTRQQDEAVFRLIW